MLFFSENPALKLKLSLWKNKFLCSGGLPRPKRLSEPVRVIWGENSVLEARVPPFMLHLDGTLNFSRP